MRHIFRLVTAAAFALALLAVPAGAMQPPDEAEPAQQHFGCVDGNPVPGHPGAAGLTHATPLVHELTGDPQPTAWNAVQHADPIISSCAN